MAAASASPSPTPTCSWAGSTRRCSPSAASLWTRDGRAPPSRRWPPAPPPPTQPPPTPAGAPPPGAPPPAGPGGGGPPAGGAGGGGPGAGPPGGGGGAGADPLALARGIVDVANAKMARAVRRISVERGHDPRGFCLVAFGGGGPLHACDIAENLGMPAVLIPRYPGATSALGLLLSDVLRDYSRTVMLRTADTDPSGLDAAFSALEERARADLDAEGVAPRQMELVRLADMRYAGQSFELPVPAPALDAARLDRDFHALHAERFGYSRPDAPTEVVNLRVKAVGHTAPLHLKQQPTGAADAAPAIRDRRTLALDAPVEVPVYDRDILSPGMAFDGPALVVQPDSTFLLRPDWRARVDEWGNLVASI